MVVPRSQSLHDARSDGSRAHVSERECHVQKLVWTRRCAFAAALELRVQATRSTPRPARVRVGAVRACVGPSGTPWGQSSWRRVTRLALGLRSGLEGLQCSPRATSGKHRLCEPACGFGPPALSPSPHLLGPSRPSYVATDQGRRGSRYSGRARRPLVPELSVVEERQIHATDDRASLESALARIGGLEPIRERDAVGRVVEEAGER